MPRWDVCRCGPHPWQVVVAGCVSSLAGGTHTLHTWNPVGQKSGARAFDWRTRVLERTWTIGQKSRCETARRAFRTRLPPKVTRQVSKTSVSYETSSKSHTSSLQNKRFVRDFLQKSHVKSPRRGLTRTKYCACHEMSPPSHIATSRFPAPATKIPLPHLKTRTKSCACHEK